MDDIIKLTYEQACDIAGVPYERGYVLHSEVMEGINEKLGTYFIGDDKYGWVPVKKCVYIVTFYFENLLGEGPEDDELYGIYSSAEKAKKAALAHEKEVNEDIWSKDRYIGYSITEYELDVDRGDVRDL